MCNTTVKTQITVTAMCLCTSPYTPNQHKYKDRQHHSTVEGHKYTTFKCSYNINITTTITTSKDESSQCIFEAAVFFKSKRLLREHSQTNIIGSLEISEWSGCLNLMFMQYNIMGWTQEHELSLETFKLH